VALLGQLNWHLNPLSTLSWRRWGDEWVAFDSGADDTHQLDPIAAVALMCFEEGPHDLAALTAQVAVELELPHDETLSQRLAELVQQFAQLGLIEPNAP
jgi:PqqD family protein of HPr-rel-A system